MATEPPVYDLVLLLDTQVDEERRTEILDNVQAAIEKAGEVVGRHDWGVRPTVYEVHKRPDADYHLFQFHGGVDAARAARPHAEDHGRRPALPDHQAPRGHAPAARDRAPPPPRPPPRASPTSPSLTSSRLRDDFAATCGTVAGRSEPRSRLGVRESREVFERSHTVAATNINRVVLTGNLTRDPELRSLPSGMSVCSLRIASNTRRKDQSGRVGGQAELLRRDRLGRPGRELRALPLQGPPGRARRPPRVARVAGPGRRSKRQSVEIIADSVQFLGGRDEGQGGGGNGFTPQSDVPVDNRDFQPVGRTRGGGARRRGRRHPVLGRARSPDRRPLVAAGRSASATMGRPRSARGGFVRPAGAS